MTLLPFHPFRFIRAMREIRAGNFERKYQFNVLDWTVAGLVL